MQIYDQLNKNVNEQTWALKQHINTIIWKQPDLIIIRNQYYFQIMATRQVVFN